MKEGRLPLTVDLSVLPPLTSSLLLFKERHQQPDDTPLRSTGADYESNNCASSIVSPRSLSKMMRAARYYGKEDIRIENIEKPTCGEGQVRVEPAFVGICGTGELQPPRL